VNPLRHLLLVFALVFAQLAGTVHALEHGADDAGVPPGHSCALCLAAHDLGAALPAAVLQPAVVAPGLPVPPAIPAGRSAVPPPPPSQRGPPTA
jgi:hypothetical protein